MIEEVGSKVSKDWKKGDRIATFVHGGNDSRPEDGMRFRATKTLPHLVLMLYLGAFAEYCLAKGDLGMKVSIDPSDLLCVVSC